MKISLVTILCLVYIFEYIPHFGLASIEFLHDDIVDGKIISTTERTENLDRSALEQNVTGQTHVEKVIQHGYVDDETNETSSIIEKNVQDSSKITSKMPTLQVENIDGEIISGRKFRLHEPKMEDFVRTYSLDNLNQTENVEDAVNYTESHILNGKTFEDSDRATSMVTQLEDVKDEITPGQRFILSGKKDNLSSTTAISETITQIEDADQTYEENFESNKKIEHKSTKCLNESSYKLSSCYKEKSFDVAIINTNCLESETDILRNSSRNSISEEIDKFGDCTINAALRIRIRNSSEAEEILELLGKLFQTFNYDTNRSIIYLNLTPANLCEKYGNKTFFMMGGILIILITAIANFAIFFAKRKQGPSINLSDIPHLNLPMENFKMKPIPRPTIYIGHTSSS